MHNSIIFILFALSVNPIAIASPRAALLWGARVVRNDVSYSVVDRTSLARIRNVATYYVSADGSDSNDGTSISKPWRTLRKVNNWKFIPGDTLRFHGGDNFAGSLTNKTLVGLPGAPITVNSYGMGRGTIDGGDHNGIYLVNAEFLALNDLEIKGSGWTGSGSSIHAINDGKGLWIQNTRMSGNRLRNITISNCKVSGFYFGVLFDTTAAGTTGFENIKVFKNVFSKNLTIGFNLAGYNSNAAGPVD